MSADDPVSKRINDAVQRLVEEFRDAIPSETVVQSVEEAVEAYRDARVTDFIPLLVYRSTREYLGTMAQDRRRRATSHSTR
jgi:hypothetical protein